MRHLLPELLGHRPRQGRPQAAAAAGAGPEQAEMGGAAIGVAAGHHQHPPAPVFAGGFRQGRPGRSGCIPGLQQQRLLARQARQQRSRQTDLDPLQLPHPGQGAVLHQPLLDQADAAGEGGAGRTAPQGPAAVGAEAAGHIDRHQGAAVHPAPLLQQPADPCFQRPVLADAEQRVDPDRRIVGGWCLLQGGDAEPAGMAPVGLGERFAPLERTPQAHGDPRQLQLPRHHQPIAAVVPRSHQHQRAALPQLRPTVGLPQPLRHGQGGLLHQRLHRQAAGEQLLLQRRHLAAGHEQVLSVAGGPGEGLLACRPVRPGGREQDRPEGGRPMMERSRRSGRRARSLCWFGPFFCDSGPG